jgi:hypothetical protein
MPGTIKKPDANPIVALLLTAFVFNLGHFLINGQQKKWIMTFIVAIVTSCCFGIGGILSIVEAYMTAVRLQKGEEIGENEYTLPILFKIVKIIDKTATCPAAEKQG